MNSKEREVLIWLTAIQGVGPQTVRKILERLKDFSGSLEELLKGRDSFYKKISLSELQIEALKNFQKKYSPQEYLQYLSEKNIDVVCWNDTVYPELLREISVIPYVLYVKGPMSFWQNLPISVVGTRHLTHYGELATEAISSELIDLGATIVSGFMYGADMKAHLTAIQKKGRTVGVLGYGFDYLPPESAGYPTQTFLDTKNTFVTEFAPFVAAHKGNFPIRNRIVAGMSHATVVTEAAQKSGSLITAQYALDFGRLVCAVPGPYTSPYSEGTKELVNQGAKLITSGFEIISELKPSLGNKNNNLSDREQKKQNGLLLVSNLAEKRILELLFQQSEYAETLSEILKIGITTTLTHLSMLEVKGLIYQKGNKWWSYL
ncbi:DNA-processing protein DprA [soil metagenome]